MKCQKCSHEFETKRAKKPDPFPVKLIPMGEVHAGQRCAVDACRRVIKAGEECYASSANPVVICLGCVTIPGLIRGILVNKFEDFDSSRRRNGASDLIRSMAV